MTVSLSSSCEHLTRALKLIADFTTSLSRPQTSSRMSSHASKRITLVRRLPLPRGYRSCANDICPPVNAGFFERDGQLLERKEIDKIRQIPCTIVQGRYDSVCPAKTAWDLHKGACILPQAVTFTPH